MVAPGIRTAAAADPLKAHLFHAEVIPRLQTEADRIAL